MWTALAVVLAIAGWQPPARRPATAARHPQPACGPVADLIQQNVGCSIEEARSAESRLGGRKVSAQRCTETCDALRARLGLHSSELKRIVLQRPAVLGLDYDSSLAPSLLGLQRR
eukprot:5184674-Prymnesium_polylepis.1